MGTASSAAWVLSGLTGIDVNDIDNGIPTLLFAIITPALITGAFVERF